MRASAGYGLLAVAGMALVATSCAACDVVPALLRAPVSLTSGHALGVTIMTLALFGEEAARARDARERAARAVERLAEIDPRAAAEVA